MTVRVVWATPNIDQMLTDIAREASGSENVGKPPAQLIRYLINHKHWSPFDMVHVCLEIFTSREVSTQMLRHRSFAFQEFSQRYAVVQERPACTEARVPAAKNRQSSTGVADEQTQTLWRNLQAEAFERAYLNYTTAIHAGVPREQARRLLPLATPTRIYMVGSLRSWVHYLQVRCAEETQQEHRDVANAIRDVLREVAPITMQAAGVL